TSASPGYGAGSGTVSMNVSNSSCSWTATSSATNWLTCSPASGTGSSTVTWSVTANVYTSSRTATLNIAGQTFTVTQAADPPPPSGPVNDNFANATVITGSSVSATGSNVGATKEPGEPPIAGNAGGASVWWSWTAPASGSVTISTAGSSFDTILGI